MNSGKLKIGTRMGIGLGLIMLLMIALIVLGILSMKNISDKMDAIIKQNNKQIWYANIIKDSMHSVDAGMLTIIQTRDSDWNTFEYVKIMTAMATYTSALEKLEGVERTPVGRDLIMRLKMAAGAARRHMERTSDLKKKGRDKEASASYLQDARSSIANLHQVCSELVSYEEAQSAKRYEEAVTTYVTARNVFIAIALVMVFFAVTAAIVLKRSITRPLREGVDIANRLADGDLDVSIEVKSNDETGQLFGALKNMVEKLRQMKDLEHQLRQSQKLETVGRLAGGIAHDFNNLLNVMLGNAELIKMQRNVDQKVRDRCGSIEKAVDRAAGFVKQLLALSRRQMLELKVVDLHHVLTDFEKMMRRMIGEHIEMIVLKAEYLPKIKADVSQVNQILLNLVVNAREAMPDGGQLVIETSCASLDRGWCSRHPGVEPGDYVLLSVTDTGVGMAEDIMDSIFEPFFTTKESGTGLGLAVVYGIVRQHGGFLDVASKVGHGTSFLVYLPATMAEEAAGAEEGRVFEMTQGDETILIVEDDEELRKTATDLLTALGYDIHVASDGREGVDMFKKHCHDIDLVLLDMVMPRLSGPDAFVEMRKINPSIPSLFVTGYSVNNKWLNPTGENGVEAIQKPYTAEGLSVKIREILDKRVSEAA